MRKKHSAEMIPFIEAAKADGPVDCGLEYQQEKGWHHRNAPQVPGQTNGEAQEPVNYSLPVRCVEEGMSTGDGQDVLRIDREDDAVWLIEVYTPADDEEEDEENRRDAHWRGYHPDTRIDMATFSNTENDGSDLPAARVR